MRRNIFQVGVNMRNAGGANMRGQTLQVTGLSTTACGQTRYGIGGGEAINKSPPFTALTLANG